MKHAALGGGGRGMGGWNRESLHFPFLPTLTERSILVCFFIFACLFVFRINLGKVNVKGRLLHILAQ